MADKTPMETLSEALARLEARGYDEEFRAEGGRVRALGGDRVFDPDALEVDEVVRFEGESNPDDEAVLFAVRTGDGLRGTLVAAYGPAGDPATAEVVRRLHLAARRAP